jgi:hypothetical protein
LEGAKIAEVRIFCKDFEFFGFYIYRHVLNIKKAPMELPVYRNEIFLIAP